ncbi:hypothetical protein POTOM_048711 [Populus tomentosa]|uniref:Omega-hydroxypalmitate O-feruloyl transferase n=1 Tax=Populus tomentosa TaxID=118781 RepID=A0A8X8CC38_POPTO|nr:hypothetical protein POTOM_048711 [Populus tomentosa]
MEGTGKQGGDQLSIKKSEPVLIEPQTRTHSGFFFLSNLDQVITSSVQTVYLYKAKKVGGSRDTLSDIFKQSMAKILVHYYPLAGRLRLGSDGKYNVECTNEGVLFVEARANCNMDHVDVQVITDDHSETTGKLLYRSPGPENILEMPLMTAQVTRFKCGGLALGISISHCMADGISAMEFIKSWAETARGMPLTTKPVLDRSILRSRQPPKIDFPFGQYAPAETSNLSNISNPFQGEQILTKCFLFDSNKLAILKNMAMEDGTVKSCSNFTALTAFVWRARCKALQMNPDQTTQLLLIVDVRSKLNPPLPKGYFGNGIVISSCLGRAGELIRNPLSFAVEEVQNGINMVNEEFVRSWIDYFEVKRAKDFRLPSHFIVTSWTRLPIECADFGRGEPAQFGCANLPADSGVFLPDGKEKKGINLILDLPVTAMSTFQELMLL